MSIGDHAFVGEKRLYEILTEKYRLEGEDPREHLIFRVPLIPGYNTQEDVEKSAKILKEHGIVDRFTYKIPEDIQV